MQCRLLQILLHDVAILRLLDLLVKKLAGLKVRHGGMLLRCLDALLDLQSVIVLLAILFALLVQHQPHVLNVLRYEDASALGAGLGLADEQHRRVGLRVLLCHISGLYSPFALVLLLLAILLDVMELGRVRPRLREEVEVLGELLLEALQVHAQGALAANIVHAEVMVHALAGPHRSHILRRDAAIGPEDVPNDLG